MSAIERARAMALADRQLGLVTRVQLVRCGLTPDRIRYLVESGFLVPEHRGVYRTAGSSDSLERRALAACMACGDGAAASHRTAAKLRQLIDATEAVPEITVPANRRPKRPGIRIFRSTLDHDELAVCGIVPVTTTERTLLDLSRHLGPSELAEAADRAFRGRWTTPQKLDVYLASRVDSRRPGVANLRTIVDDRLGRGVPESILESRMLALLRRWRLPDPIRQLQVVIAGRTARFDLAYPAERVAIELDGRSPHWGKERWQADHRRDNAIELGAWRKLSFTWWDVTEEDRYVAFTVAAALGLRPASWRRTS